MASAPAGQHQPGTEPDPVKPDRIAALDLIRGVAVLGILAINIAGFAGPLIATTTPHLPHPGTLADEIAFAAAFVLFEGKMRALFTILFGASMLLFLERAEAAGKDAPPLQLRRLGWLMLFGYLHFALIWWGDILFVYAFCGFVALAFRFVSTRSLVIFALTVFTFYHVQGIVGSLPDVIAEAHAGFGNAAPKEAAQHREAMLGKVTEMDNELALYRGSYVAQVGHRLTEQRFFPLAMAIGSICETLPLMLLGMALYRTDFFSGGWSAQGGRHRRGRDRRGRNAGRARLGLVAPFSTGRHERLAGERDGRAPPAARPGLCGTADARRTAFAPVPARRPAERCGTNGVLQLYRDEPGYDRDFLRLGARPVRHRWGGGAMAVRGARLGADARLEQAMARAIRARTARMGVAFANRMAGYAPPALNAIAIPSH